MTQTAVEVLGGDVAAAESTIRTRSRGPSGRESRQFPLGSVVALALILWAFVQVNQGRTELFNRGGFSEVTRFFRSAIHPRLDVEFLRIARHATAVTLSYAILATVLSGGIGLLVGSALSQTWRKQVARSTAVGAFGKLSRLVLRLVLVPLRGIHEVIWALLLLNVFGLDPLVAVGALTIPFAAITAKVFASHLDAVDPKAARALRAGGASELQVFFYGVLPTALPDLTSYVFYRFECAIRAAAVLGVIGAGGIGYELSLSFQSLAYSEMWTMLFALILISGLADAISTKLRKRQAKTSKSSQELRRGHAKNVGGLAALFVASVWSFNTLHLVIAHLWSERSRKLFNELRKTWFPPDLAWRHLRLLTNLSFDTLAVSVVAITLSLLLAVPVSFLASRRSDSGRIRRFAGVIARLILLVTRAIPPSVWAFLTVLMFFSGLFPAAVALGLYNFGVLGRLLAEIVENLDPIPARALRARGARPVQVLAYAVAPIAASRFGSYSLYRWEVATRETIVVGIVAAGGLGNQLKQRMAAFDYPQVTTALLFFIGLTLLVDVMSGWMRRRID